MLRDGERISRITAALAESNFDALICALPQNLRLLSGYWPVIGASVAIVTRDGAVSLIVPTDEQDLARRGWADNVHAFSPGSLDRLTTAAREVVAPLTEACQRLGLTNARIGCEIGPSFVPATYASMHLYGDELAAILSRTYVRVTLVDATPLLARLRAVLTSSELATLRAACGIAAEAFTTAAPSIRAGISEAEVAATFRAPLSTIGLLRSDISRADGFCWCLSGTNSAEASAAYARTRSRQIAAGDLVLVHCNSYADGLWTDITRTYVLDPSDRERRAYQAIFDARDAALDAVRPGRTGAGVDRAAREALRKHGYDKQFRHGTGHGVGFAAISHDAIPRIHPASDDILEPGMVFNVEPAIYEDGWGGMRHCDMVAVTETGAELLTDFHSSPRELILQAPTSRVA